VAGAIALLLLGIAACSGRGSSGEISAPSPGLPRQAVPRRYATYTDEQLPVIWMPEAYAAAAVTSKLANVAFNALADLTPEYWHFTS
jgi:hypothetical protein